MALFALKRSPATFPTALTSAPPSTMFSFVAAGYYPVVTGVKDVLLVVVGCALIVHIVFKRWEPWNVPTVAALTVVLPAVLSLPLVDCYGLILALVISCTTFFSTLFSSIIIYRLSPFHRLAKYPGPTACKISALWTVWKIRDGKRYLYIQSLHKQYGDVVRIGPNELSFCSPTVIQPVLTWPKGPGMKGRSMHQNPLPLISLQDPAEHARRRKPWNRAFNSAALKEYQPTVAKRVAQLVETLQAQEGETDLAEWISYFTYDFMGDMAFGGGTEMLREGDKDGLWKLLKRGMSTAMYFEHVPWLSYYVARVPALTRDLTHLRALAFKRTITRYQSGSSAKDLFYYLSNEDRAEEECPPQRTVISDAVLVIVAGADTTATTLSNVFYHLMCNPNSYKRLQEEVDKFYPQGEDALNTQHHVNMPYLEAVMNEAMRLHPAVVSGSMRTPPRGSGGRLVGKHFVPEGTQTRLHPYTMHHDARNFSHPDVFWPDRWLIAGGHLPSSEKIAHNPDAFMPFSVGPNNCVGKNLALLEMRMLICYVMQRLEMRFVDGWDQRQWLEELDDAFVTRMGKLPVVLQRRY